jgi:hypothetical protein
MSVLNDSVSLKPRKSERNGCKFVLPTDRIAFPKQLSLLRAWAAASGPANKMVTNDDVARMVKMVPTTVQMANPFFADIGLLQKMDGGFVPSPEVVSFNRAFEWSPETSPQKLAPIIEHSWFGEALLPRLSFDALGTSEAIQVLAEAATVGPDKESQLTILLSYMEASGLIVGENGTIRRARQNGQTEPGAKTESPTVAAPKPGTVATAFMAPTEGVIQFHVSVKVDMKEFAGWQPDRIARFFSGIAEVLAAKGNVEKSMAN